MAKGASRNKNPRNGATVRESDPLRAPVCRKGKLIGEVSTNWKALCQVRCSHWLFERELVGETLARETAGGRVSLATTLYTRECKCRTCLLVVPRPFIYPTLIDSTFNLLG